MTTEARNIGTDGVRGVANVEPVTAEDGVEAGAGGGHVF